MSAQNRNGGRGPDRKWIPLEEGIGWIQAMNAIAILARQHCDGIMLRGRGVAPNSQYLKYKYYFGYCHSKHCPWYCLLYLPAQPAVDHDQRPTLHRDNPWQVS